MKKKFGQNFLINQNIINQILDIAQINNKSIVYEIGPGNGALTREIIVRNPKQFLAIEIDNSLKKNLDYLFNKDNHKIIFSDALSFDETIFFKKNALIIGNLPYNISLKLLTKWIYQLRHPAWFNQMILMFQKEVAERIIAQENSKKFGRITLLVSAFFEVTKILDVDRTNFYPSPKVDSSILNFKILKNSNFDINNINKLEYLTKNLFSNRRKKIKNKIKFLFNEEIIKKYKLDNYYDLRAENLKKQTIFFLAKLLE